MKLRNFVPFGLRLQNLTPKRQFPETKDISGLRDAVKTVFSENHFSVDRSRVTGTSLKK